MPVLASVGDESFAFGELKLWRHRQSPMLDKLMAHDGDVFVVEEMVHRRLAIGDEEENKEHRRHEPIHAPPGRAAFPQRGRSEIGGEFASVAENEDAEEQRPQAGNERNHQTVTGRKTIDGQRRDRHRSPRRTEVSHMHRLSQFGRWQKENVRRGLRTATDFEFPERWLGTVGFDFEGEGGARLGTKRQEVILPPFKPERAER